MKRVSLLAILVLLVVGCVSKPEPWTPDGRVGDVDAASDTPGRNGDGKGDLGPSDVASADGVDMVSDATEVMQDVDEVLDEVVCVPDCTGIECGDDGCGGSCGECGAFLTCAGGICHPDYCDFGLGEFGCCAGNVWFWCDAEEGLKWSDCGGNNPPLHICGWKKDQYQCGGSEADPSGILPLECCLPECGGKECGSDGCWKTCGTCTGAQEKCEAGKCVCAPTCEGKDCGDDGCGGECGPCEGAQDECVEGICVCQPSCEGKACGDDGCGGDCGTCEGAQDECIEGECVCQAACEGKECGDDGCGGECGECDDGNPCNGLESCEQGTCLAGDPVDCSGAPQCIKEECNPENGLCDLPVDDGKQCDDADACTTGDNCIGGQCQGGKPLACDDGNECTEDSCAQDAGCLYLPVENGTPCDEGVGECSAGTCQPVTQPCPLEDCPELGGYAKTCNAKGHCEYSRAEQTEDWHQWDVWIYVPPGSFQMGSEGEGGLANETPVHAVTFDYGFFVGKFEVVVGQYEACIADDPSSCTSPSSSTWDGDGWGTNTSDGSRSDHPQNGLTWKQAGGFCSWVAPGGRLPSEAEWEYSASGPEHKKFPWGNVPEPSCSGGQAVFDEDGSVGRPWGCSGCTEAGCSGTTSVLSALAGASQFGAIGMSGNVCEWTADSYHADYINAPMEGGPWSAGGEPNKRVARGGAFDSNSGYLRTAWRGVAAEEDHSAKMGARCVRPAPPPGGQCGGVQCPAQEGYSMTCNRQKHCEYYNLDTTGWKKWDVWVYVPPGSFEMGSPEGEPGHESDEWPLQSITFALGFLIAKFPATAEQYEACMADEAWDCTAPSTADWDGSGWGVNASANGRSTHPQNGLTWQQAEDYCSWAAPGGRLPSEAEREYAATGTIHRKYPWGDSPEPTCTNGTAAFNELGGAAGYGCGAGGTVPVGSMVEGTSWSGILDASGNVWEWCADWHHDSYEGLPPDGTPHLEPPGSMRSVRGGAFGSATGHMRTAARHAYLPGARLADTGVRCVRPVVCVPACDGKECGADGCGGECGGCEGAQDECVEGICVCQPACEGKECGDDGCDGECGQCGEGGICLEQHGACQQPGWVAVNPGAFKMGTPASEPCHVENEAPVHKVVIPRTLLVSDHEVTRAEWTAITGGPDPSWFGPGGGAPTCLTQDCPVDSVNWYEALTYCNLLSESLGLQNCYVLNGCQGQLGGGCTDISCEGDYSCESVGFIGTDCQGFRVPTEAEWEYFARAGSEKALAFPPPLGGDKTENCACQVEPNLEDYAWYCKNSGNTTHPVRDKSPNAWGLYDTAGNLWEWCWDSRDDDYYGASGEVDPMGGQSQIRVLRGCGHGSPTESCRTGYRGGYLPEYRNKAHGFRVVRSLSASVCVSDCLDKDCGDNGCGGSCGECSDGLDCVDDNCTIGDGLVGWWSFSEGDGEVVHDVTGNGHDGQATDGTWVAGLQGTAMEFNGTSTRVDTGTSLKLDGSPAMSLVVRFKTSDDVTAQQEIVSKTRASYGSGYWLDVSQQHIRARLYADSADTLQTPCQPNTWYHAVLTYSGGTASLFLEGELEGALTLGGPVNDVPPEGVTEPPLQFGCTHLGSMELDRFFKGIIDDVRVYDRALEPAEVQLLYQSGM